MSLATRRTRSGFTLLEVMLAMTALALVSVMCYGAFYLAIRAVERGAVAVVTAQRLRAANELLSRQIKSISWYRRRDEDRPYYFEGTQTGAKFVSAAGVTGGGSLTQTIYQVLDNPKRLVLEENHFFSPTSLAEQGPEPESQYSAVLLDGFRELTFEYYSAEEERWYPEWPPDGDEGTDQYPTRMRISVYGLNGIGVEPWTQIVPLMVATQGDSLGEPPDAGDDDELLFGVEGENEGEGTSRDAQGEPDDDGGDDE